MARLARPYLLDVTRLVSRSWTRRRSTGIDRVCYAYLDRFSERAHAVVQHRGVFRICSEAQSDTLFALLRSADDRFRLNLAAFAARLLAATNGRRNCEGATYLNVSHTDFDLPSHHDWAAACGFRSVYLIHDLIPLTHPELCTPHAVRRHQVRIVNALRRADGLIANSHSTARDLGRFSRTDGHTPPPVLAAPIAGADLVAARTDPRPCRPYFLTVGTIEPRKNHSMLLRIWERLAETMADAPDLVIIGQWGRGSEPVRRWLNGSAILRERVKVLDHCDDAELAGWMAHAQAVLLPSVAEGFGLPLVESLALGTPVIASGLPSFREFGQGIPTYLNAVDTSGWEALISGFADHPERGRQLRQAAGFSRPRWTDHFAAVEDWLSALPVRFPRAGAARIPASAFAIGPVARVRGLAR